MDMTTVQQQLKSDIAEHQVIMTKLKRSPEDEELRKSLKEIQKHIAMLGMLQKKLGKNKSGNTDKSQAHISNGFGHESVELNHSGFVKLGDKLTKENGNVTIRIRETDNKTLELNNVKQEERNRLNCQIGKNTAEGTTDPGNKDVLSPTKGALQKADIATTSTSINESQNGPSNVEPLNLCSNTSKEPSTTSVEVKPQITTNNSTKLSLTKKILLKSPMKIKVPMSNGNPIVLLPTTIMKPQTSNPVFRLTATPRNSPGTARVWFNVTGTSSGQTQPRLIPATIRAPQQLSKGSFQKFRIIGGSVKPSTSHHLTTNYGPRPRSTQLKAVLMNPISSVASENAFEEKPKLLKLIQNANQQLHVDVTPTVSPDDVLPTKGSSPNTKSARPYAAVPDALSKKIAFMGNLSLVPREKADKMKNRRYGRRRAVANPVYSGGLYVSTTAADSTKRVIPPELLGIEGVPVKRPRGRPRGSTKRNLSPPQPLDGVEDECQRILRETKPRATSSDCKSIEKRGSLKGKKTMDRHEDLCSICGKAGEMLMCDTCSRVYHVVCLTPPLAEVPNEMWICELCKDKFKDHSAAPTWPGLMSIVHSYFAFDSRREMAIKRAREKVRAERARNLKLEEQTKVLKCLLKHKVAAKNKCKDELQDYMNTCERLTSVLERIRCSVNRTIDPT